MQGLSLFRQGSGKIFTRSIYGSCKYLVFVLPRIGVIVSCQDLYKINPLLMQVSCILLAKKWADRIMPRSLQDPSIAHASILHSSCQELSWSYHAKIFTRSIHCSYKYLTFFLPRIGLIVSCQDLYKINPLLLQVSYIVLAKNWADRVMPRFLQDQSIARACILQLPNWAGLVTIVSCLQQNINKRKKSRK